MEYITSRIRLHFEVAFLMFSVRRRLKPMGLEKLVRWVAARDRVTTDECPPDRVMRAVQRVGRWLLPGSNCLAQSVTMLGMLNGRDVALVLGCGRDRGAWSAHAWVELNGVAYQPVYAAPQTELSRYCAADDWRPRPALAA